MTFAVQIAVSRRMFAFFTDSALVDLSLDHRHDLILPLALDKNPLAEGTLRRTWSPNECGFNHSERVYCLCVMSSMLVDNSKIW